MSDNASPERTMPALACNVVAIPAEQRPRYRHLVQRLRGAVEERRALPDGYTFRLEASRISLPEASEWISMERRCCPFLTMDIETTGTGELLLTLRGPDGVRAFLDAELGLGAGS